ncbi:SusD/RagB family nutrient-binding outer membrane lipoprotein [Flavobacterium cheongpyeongense]|nr:SusD/RagB family nutrient-binding outer membrane lipoprotein [Flavobacterium cheongpyeongense]
MAVTISSCTDDITGLNEDTKNPTTTKSEYLFTNAQKAMSDQMVNTSVNLNVFRLFTQQWTETTYLDETQYNITTRNIPNSHWGIIYRDVLRDFLECKKLLDQETPATTKEIAILNNKKAILEIMSVYSYSVLVDTFGNIPYSEALDIIGHPQPKYDDAQTIYRDLISRLTAASAAITASEESFGTADLYYEGDAASWKKFANSLKLRLAINMDDTDHTYASTQVSEAVAQGILTSNADNALIHYVAAEANNVNPIYNDLVASGRNDYVIGKTFVDAMNSLNDPRRPKYMTTVGGSYIGGTIGATNSYASYSHVNAEITKKDFPGTLLSYSEVEFLLAEAAARGISVGGTAVDHYNAAITASMKEWGVASGDINSYLEQSSVEYNPANWKKSIGEQAWIALYNRGFESWTSYRRLDYPNLLPSLNPYNDLTAVPTRYSYPAREQTLNATNVEAAITAIGGDGLTVKIFWDKY